MPTPADPGAARRLALAAIAGFALVAVAGVLLRPLIPIDETRYVDVAWEMREEASWLLPIKNHALYTDKPPLLFWLINLVWMLTGISETAARLVGPAFGVATLAGTWALGRRLWGDATGARAAAVLAGMTVFVLFAGATMFDTLLTTATLAGLWALWSALERPGIHWRAWIGFGLALGFGVLAKGPVILFHLGPALLLAPLWADPAQRPRAADLLRGAACALALAGGIVALWLVPAAIAGGAEYRHMVLWEQSAGRAVKSFAHARPFWWLVALLPAILFPWVLWPALWPAVGRALREGLRRDRALRLMLVQAGAGLLLFSLISGKQVHYLMPELPAVALIMARGLGGVTAGRWQGAPLAALLAALALGAAGTAAGLWADARTQALMQPAAAPAGFALALGLLALLVLARPRPWAFGAAGLGLALALVGLVAGSGLGPAYDTSRIAQRLAAHETRGYAVLTDRYHDQFDFTGRLHRRVDTPQTATEAAAWLAAHPGGMLAGVCDKAPALPPPAERIFFYGDDWCLWVAP